MIRLTRVVRIAGAEVASGTNLSLNADEEARLVAQGVAEYYIARPNVGARWRDRQALRPLRRSNILTKCWSGKLTTVANGADHTTHIQTVAECPYQAIRIGILNSVTSSIANVTAAVGQSAVIGSKAGTSGHSATWTACTFAGSSTATLAAGTSASVPSITWSDWMTRSYVERTDGGTLPVLAVRVFIPAAAANRPAYNYTDTSGWNTDTTDSNVNPPFGRTFRIRTQAVEAVTTPANFTSTTFDGQGVPVIIQYQPRDCVGFTIAVAGDSIDEGTGDTIRHHGWHQYARAMLSSREFPIEICNVAMAATTMSQQADWAAIWVPAVLPEYCVYPTFSPNDVAPPTMTTAQMNSMAFQAGRVRRVLGANDVRAIHRTGIPINAAAEDYGATDVERVIYGAQVRAMVQNGEMVFDAERILSGATDGDGQVQILTGATSDNIHPNRTGHELLASDPEYGFCELLAQLKAQITA